MRTMLKSKIHRARVTDANIDYEGSVTIDRMLMAAADILPYEEVHVLNINNGARFTTYAIEGEAGKGDICLNNSFRTTIRSWYSLIKKMPSPPSLTKKFSREVMPCESTSIKSKK
jgi:L-aspartate-alpha-decarboxylase